MNRRVIKLICAVILFGYPTELLCEEPVKITRITGTIEFDGIPDEKAWESLSTFTLIMHKPVFGSQPSEISKVIIGFDNEYLWIGARLYMKDGSKIFAVSRKRDEELTDQDAFGIILDTYDDNENGLAFFTSPTGLRTDFSISNDAAQPGGGSGSNSSFNYSWNTFWDVRSKKDDSGWYVEMRIPFSSLKFKSDNDITRMGLIISRNISANNEIDTYPEIDPRHGNNAIRKPSLAKTIEITGARPSKPVYISPYLLGGFSRDWSINENQSEYFKTDLPEYNAGVDIKYNINSNLTLDITANTDFAQVEADDRQVNLTRYSLSFPEKRMFFQERSSLFGFSLQGSADNLFYSRNIGIADGEPVRIYGGARLTGRIGKWDMGFLDMQTKHHEDLPGENFGALRMRRQVINQNSYIGGILTSRIGMNGEHNLAYGFDGIFRVFGDDYLNVKWSQTFDSETGSTRSSLDPSFMLVSWQKRSEKGFAYNIKYSYSGEQFNPGLGFVQMTGVQCINGELKYGWIPGTKSRLFNYNFKVKGRKYTRLEDGRLENMKLSPEFEFNTRKGIYGVISVDFEKDGVLNDFMLSDSITVNAGEYSFLGFDGDFGTPDSRLLAARGTVYAGQFYDGYRFGLEAGPNLNLSSSLKLSAIYIYNFISFPERGTGNSLAIHSVNFKALFMFSTRLSATVMMQYVNTENDFITNFRLRYNHREGNDFYLVYNDYRGVSRSLSEPVKPVFYTKTIMLKYIHTFTL